MPSPGYPGFLFDHPYSAWVAATAILPIVAHEGAEEVGSLQLDVVGYHNGNITLSSGTHEHSVPIFRKRCISLEVEHQGVAIRRAGVVGATIPWPLVWTLDVLIPSLIHLPPHAALLIVEFTSFLYGPLQVNGGIIHVLV